MGKTRLDALLVERGMAQSRERAKADIMGGNVIVGGSRAVKPGVLVDSDASIEVRSLPEYVSRGGKKLEKALRFFGVSVEGKVCIDCGASTGGFTDCLLRHGARLVYAVDVGYGQLAWSIRTDPRVVTMERTNIRYVTMDAFEERPELAAVDLSFISLRLVLPVLRKLIDGNGEILCLIKPQFEAGREYVGKHGVVRDPSTHMAVLDDFVRYAVESGFFVGGLSHSPLKGPKGNIEYLGRLSITGEGGFIDTGAVVSKAHDELSGIHKT